MTVEECYKNLHGDYEQAKRILMSDSMIEKFMLKFIDDNSYEKLMDGVKSKNIKNAFEGAHALKGVCANLAFEELRSVTSDLTEKLRGANSFDGTDDLVEKVKESYDRVIRSLKEYK